MSKCLVTGGAGFVGSNLVDKLIDLGHEVTVIDNLISGAKEYINSQAYFYNINITDQKVLDIFVKHKFNFVFHLAAQINVRKSVEDPIFDNQVNVLGSLNILEAAHNSKVKKIIFTSTGGAIYGDTKNIPTDESEIPNPISPYGIHKLTFEKYLNYYHKVFGQAYLTLRPANIYGPRQFKGGEAGVVAIFVENAIQKKQSVIYGDGKITRDFVYVDDVVDAIIKSMNVDYVGEINIATSKEVSILYLVEQMERVLNDKLDIVFDKSRFGDVARSSLDFSKAKEILDWKPNVDLLTGIQKTIEWTKNK